MSKRIERENLSGMKDPLLSKVSGLALNDMVGCCVSLFRGFFCPKSPTVEFGKCFFFR